MGGDIEELYQEIEQEKELADEHGITPDYGGKTNGEESSTESGDENGNDKPGDGVKGRSDSRPRLLL